MLEKTGELISLRCESFFPVENLKNSDNTNHTKLLAQMKLFKYIQRDMVLATIKFAPAKH